MTESVSLRDASRRALDRILLREGGVRLYGLPHRFVHLAIDHRRFGRVGQLADDEGRRRWLLGEEGRRNEDGQ